MADGDPLVAGRELEGDLGAGGESGSEAVFVGGRVQSGPKRASFAWVRAPLRMVMPLARGRVDRGRFCTQGPAMNRRPPLFRNEEKTLGVDAHGPLLESIRAGKIEFHAVGRGHYPGARLGARELPGLLSLGYWDARGNQDWGMDFHRNGYGLPR